MTEPVRVLVLGGGYAAIHVCRRLKKAIRSRRVEATVVSRENSHSFHGFVGEMVTGRLSPSHILSPARRVFAPARVHIAEVERIDLDRATVTTSRKLDGARFNLEYDQLVLCLGSTDRLEVYPGLAEHAFRLKTYEDCLRLRNHIIEMFELADIEDDPNERRRLLTFFIAGGGFAGTEVAGDLADLATRLTRCEYAGIDREECRFVLVEPGASILPELQGNESTGAPAHPRLVEYGMKHMEELGVEVRANTLVSAATPSEVTLSSGERIPTRTIISAVGTKMTPVVERLGLPKDGRGRIVTERTLQVPGHDNLWAAGDCAAVPLPAGGTSPPVALYAMKHGAQIGRNLVRVLDGGAPAPFRFRGLGQGASVGRRAGVVELKGLELTGLPAWLVWRLLLFYYFPSNDRRLRIIADWLIWPLVGRDIVELPVGARGDYEVVHNIFQPEEVIVTEERAGKYIHVIVEGEVELVHARDGLEQVLRTLGPGDHFGVRWIESFEPEIARAKGVVRTVAIRRDQAPRLQEVLGSAGQLVAESGHFPAIVDRGRP